MQQRAIVLGALAGVAVLQLPGGLITMPDPRALLLPGDEVDVDVVDAALTLRADLLAGPYDVQQQGELALLRSGSGTVPLVLPSRAPLPACVVLALHVHPTETAEGVEGACPPCSDIHPNDLRAATGASKAAPH